MSTPKRIDRVGEIYTARNGLTMTIIRYGANYDVDVQFEDGVIVSHQQYVVIRKGWVKHPNINTLSKKCGTMHLGETAMSSCGLMMTIIAWRTVRDIDIQFEDGAVVEHKQWICFHRGNIAYPFTMLNMQVTKQAYVANGLTNYFCRCTNCGHKDIMTIPEMKSHICNI